VSGRKGGFKDALRVGFNVTALGAEDFFGFGLDSDGRYLLSDFTVTHNSGKTRVLNSLQLALEGQDERLGKQGVELMKLAPGREGELFSLATLAGDGLQDATAEFRVRGSAARASKPTHTMRNITSPAGAVLNGIVAGVLKKSAKAQREAILKAAAPLNCLELARLLVPDAFRVEWARAVELARAELRELDVPEADVLVAVAESLRERMRSTKKAIKSDPGERPIALLEQDLAALRTRVGKFRAARDSIAKRDAARSRLLELRAQVQALPEQAQAGAPDKAKVAETRRRLDALKIVDAIYEERQLGAKADGPDPHCPTCGAHALDAQDDQKINLATLEGNVVALELALKSPQRPADKLVQEIERLEAAEREALQALPETAQELLASQVTDRLGELERELAEAEQQAVAVSQWDNVRANRAQAEGSLVVVEALSKAAASVVEESLQRGLKAFCKRASAPLGSFGRLDVKLFEGHRPVCEVGLWRPGAGKEEFIAWDTLSGAQQVLAASGLATAWAARVTAPVKLVTVDDVWMGSAALLSVLKALRSAVLDDPDGPTQAIVCAVELSPAVRLAADDLGWLVVQVD